MLSFNITKKRKESVANSLGQKVATSSNSEISKSYDKQQFVGFMVYVILILVFIPYVLKLYKPSLLTFYIPNVDMIANILTTINKPDIFSKLYISEPDDVLSFISLNLINWISLMGIAYAISYVSYTKGIRYGMIAGGIMFFMTYLLPTQILPYLIRYVDKHRYKDMDFKNYEYILLYIFAFLTAISIIMFESYIVESLT